MCPARHTIFRPPVPKGRKDMAKQTKPNCCPNCNKTHEECSDGKTCPKWQISLHVCKIFGTRPRSFAERRRQAKLD
ncbi:hypothetical protein [Streptomyces phage Psst1]|nr:hypothetical protein [Streptomyces phage Psst1]WPJ30741.1 hypothetical protein [Streptomyces phage Psst2]